MLSEQAGAPRLAAPGSVYLITWRRVKGRKTPPKSGLEEGERRGTIVCSDDAGLSGDAATEMCKWGSSEHLQLFMGCNTPDLLAKGAFPPVPGFGSVLLSERSLGVFAS